MILWLTGNTMAGKTTLARQLKCSNTIVLDGDEVRDVFKDKDLTPKGRREHNIKVARMAKMLESQGFTVIVAVIAPYEDLRRDIQRITDCRFIYIEGGKSGNEYPYEEPKNAVLKISKDNFL